MAKRISVLNGTNKNQDYDFLQFQTTQLNQGVAQENDLEIQPQGSPDNTVIVKAGIACITVARTTDSKVFNVFGENTTDFNLTIPDTGTNPTWICAVVAVVLKSKIEDGSANAEDGTGIFDVITVAGQSTSPLSDGDINTAIGANYYWVRLADVVQDPTVASGDITDQRTVIGVKRVLTPNDKSLKAFDASGVAQEVLKLLTSGDYPEFQITPRLNSGQSISNDQDFITKKYFEDNLPSGGTISFELAENLTVEDLVSIINDGGTAKIRGLIPNENGSEQQLTTDPSGSWGDATAVDDNKVVYVYERSNAIYGVCMTISGTVLTIGSKVTISSGTASNHGNVCKLDTDKFVVGYRYYDGTHHARTVACTVSGTTISVGSPVDAKTSLSGSVKVLQMGTNKFVAVYGSGNSSTWSGTIYGRVATVSGTTISYGTEQTLIASVTDISIKDSAVRVADDKFYVFSNSDVLYCTISGTTITANARTDIATQITGVAYVGITASYFLIYETGYIHAYSHDGAGTETYIGTTEVSFVVPQILGLETDGKFLLGDTDGTDGYRKAWIEDNEVKFSAKYEPSGASGSWQRVCQFGSSSLNQFFYALNDVYGLIATVNDFEDFAGILQETGTAGQSKPIAVKGSQSAVHSFADADVGKKVYIQDDASLDVAQSANQIGQVYTNAIMVINT